MSRRWLVLGVLFTTLLNAQTNWPGYGHDKGGQRYSPLTQINTGNVSRLVQAWTFDMKKAGQPFRASESIPLVVDGLLYLSWPFNHVAALKPDTGKVIWEFSARSGFSGKLGSMRSLDYWPGDAQSPPEILFGTEEGELYALNAKTGKPVRSFGKLKWWFQAIHHDLWDYDMPVPPVLFDVVRDGRRIPAVGAMTKMGMLFILDRATGKPIYGVEERPVPKGDLPGEYYSPTQPFPVKPPPLARLSFNMNDIAKITPEHEKACRDLLEKHDGGHNRGPYTPATADGALVFPTTGGGANWTGGTFDAAHGYYIINTTDSGGFRSIRPQDQDPGAPPESPRLYSRESGGRNSASINGWPCWQPPWGRLSAIDVSTGEIAWQVPFGSVEGTPDTMKTGEELWSTQLEEVAQSVPITWEYNGIQYVAVSAGSKLLTFQMPEDAIPKVAK